MILTILMLTKQNILSIIKYLDIAKYRDNPLVKRSERTLQGNVSHLKAILMLGEGCTASPFPRSSIDDHLAMQLG